MSFLGKDGGKELKEILLIGLGIAIAGVIITLLFQLIILLLLALSIMFGWDYLLYILTGFRL